MAMRILQAAQRDAMFEIYRLCREVDDLADSSGPRPARIAQLGEWRDEINDLYQGKIGSKVVGLAAPLRRFDFRREDFLAVIDGMEMDAREDIRAPSFATLDLYCDRVASAVGRLSVRVFGEDAEGSSCRTIWDGRCSSPTSCATSTKMPGSGACICRAKRSNRRGSPPPIH
jgi:phytoene synthase